MKINFIYVRVKLTWGNDMAIQISDLRQEIQTLVRSNPMKYDPNGNGIIDDGEEISLLLSEYGCKESELASKKHPGKTMLTKKEEEEVNLKTKYNLDNEIYDSEETWTGFRGFNNTLAGWSKFISRASAVATLLISAGTAMNSRKTSLKVLAVGGAITALANIPIWIRKHQIRKECIGNLKNSQLKMQETSNK